MNEKKSAPQENGPVGANHGQNHPGPIAHVRQHPDGTWETHPLPAHLDGTANLAAGFAAEFGAAEWARLAGLWHDLGKYNPQFQRYIGKASGYNPEAHLEGDASRPDHSTAGAPPARWCCP